MPLIDLVVDRFPRLSRDEILARIACGEVLVDGGKVRNSKERVSEGVDIAFIQRRYVSRGGAKLEAALYEWKIQVHGKVFLDAGASTGGFSDCLLQHGAAKVHSVDVGYNQLDYRLRSDPRVSVHERTNIMQTHPFEPRPHAAVSDLSFRSLVGAASKILSLTSEGWCIGLIKPQFEIRDPGAAFDGIVRESDLLREILLDTLLRLLSEGVYTERLMESPIRGGKGNREFLGVLRQSPRGTMQEIEVLVDTSLRNIDEI